MSNELSRIGAVIADPTRAEILLALLDGTARTGSELARHAGVAASTASEHLGKLLDAGLVGVASQGRHRYWRLADQRVAVLVETLGAAAPAPTRRSPVPGDLARARRCYDHLAGRLGVALYDAMAADGRLATQTGTALLTADGIRWFAAHGVALTEAGARRPLARACLDWTERTDHLAGRAGQALLELCLDRGWVRPGTRPRVLDITRRGRQELAREFGDLALG